MADNVTFQSATLATPPDTTVVSTDEAASGHVQRMKLTQSANGSDTPITADADGLLVNLGTNNDVSVTGSVTVAEPVSVDDNAGSLTVDAADGTFFVRSAASGTFPINVGRVGGNTTSVGSGTVDTGTQRVVLPTDANTVKVGDGSNTATIRNLAANDALNVALVDAAGDQVTSFGGGTQYTEGDIDATITGTAMLWEDNSDTLSPVNAFKPLPVRIIDTFWAFLNGQIANAITGPGYVPDEALEASRADQPPPVLVGGIASSAAPTDVDADGDVAMAWFTRKGALNVADAGGSLTVDGTVAVSGTVAVTQSGTWDEVGINDSGNSITVDAPVGTPVNVQIGDGTETAAVLNTGSNDSLAVAIVDGSGTQITSFGGGTQYTEGDTDATITGTAMLWEDAGNTLRPVASGTPLPVGDAGGSLTVDGTVTANLAAGTNNIGDVDVLSIAAGDNNIGNVDIVTMPAVTVTGVSTLTEQQTQTTHLATIAGDTTDIEAAVELLDDTVYTDDTSTHATGTSKGLLFMAAATPTDSAVNANDIGAVGMTTDRKLHVSVQDALPAGSANIGDVDVLTVPSPLSTAGNGTAATAHRVTIASDSTGQVAVASLPASTNTIEVVGDVAHSAGVAGNPVLMAGVAQAHDDTAPPNRVDAESDTTRLATDFDGQLFVRPHGAQVWTYHLNTSTAQTDATVHAAPSSGLSLYVGTIVFSSGAATAINMFLEEGASTVMGPYYLEAVAGRGMAVQFNPPRKITAATALTITTSASIAHSVDITGFTAQG